MKNIPAEYRNFEIDRIEDLRLVVEETPDLCGLNVTIPYKESIIPFLDEMDGTAQMIGAVNVVKFIPGKDKMLLKGYNSDIIGFTDSIRPYIKDYHRKALILGTGGASKAVWYGLLSLGIDPQLVSRTPREGVLSYEELTPRHMEEFQIIVNATPLGMYPQTDTCPNIPYDAITPQHLAYDLVYNPETTLFLEKMCPAGSHDKERSGNASVASLCQLGYLEQVANYRILRTFVLLYCYTQNNFTELPCCRHQRK